MCLRWITQKTNEIGHAQRLVMFERIEANIVAPIIQKMLKQSRTQGFYANGCRKIGNIFVPMRRIIAHIGAITKASCVRGDDIVCSTFYTEGCLCLRTLREKQGKKEKKAKRLVRVSGVFHSY